ncbi:hypothetical protein H6G33_10170 [Calothrix sp. FACHB-1219]|uniref:hypothetical protein n=1 Tax=unclassified Calothrix TaxID=2619626 RepID=UPI0016820185|nr:MULTISPECIES: hypothetical protein [unclassified Calothrix]MBD2201713.1 hypothetical protein [Calothrix sp. FACHB-168]MBD2217399.1 hypothetical protein [Calothrix sp. FACHB-1219]
MVKKSQITFELENTEVGDLRSHISKMGFSGRFVRDNREYYYLPTYTDSIDTRLIIREDNNQGRLIQQSLPENYEFEENSISIDHVATARKIFENIGWRLDVEVIKFTEVYQSDFYLGCEIGIVCLLSSAWFLEIKAPYIETAWNIAEKLNMQDRKLIDKTYKMYAEESKKVREVV